MSFSSQFSRCLLLSILSSGVLSAHAEVRTFTNEKGQKIKAEVTAVKGSKVTLKMANGRSYTISTDTLSLADQVYVDEWSKKKQSGDGKPGVPDDVTYRIEFEADKKRQAKGTTRKVNSGELKNEQWIYEVSLENKSRVTLEGLEMSYRVYIDPVASSKVGLGDPTKVFGGREKVASLADGASVMIKTDRVPLTELELDPDFVFTDGSRNDLEDKLEGIWIKVWHGEKKVAEFKSNNSTVKKAEWPDSEAADPNAEEEEEKPADQEVDPKE